MRSTPLASKHRATEPVPTTVRPETTGAHRAARSTDLPVAAALGILLLLVAAYLAVRG
jgi:hypothetical protein